MFHGTRMRGEWLLVRMKPRPDEKRENWLLRKVAGAYAGASGDLVDTALTSIDSGRSVAEIAKGDDPVWHSDKAKAKGDKSAANAPGKTPPGVPRPRRPSTAARKPPGFQPVQLATLTDTVPSGSGWIHEVKFDGYRTLLSCGEGTAKAYTRTGLDWSDRFAPIVATATDLAPQRALIDGAVVALDEDGRPSFSALQAALEDGGPFHYFAFDLLEEGGEDLRDQLSELGLQSYPMASGGKGVHVIVPLDRTRDWAEVKDFASRFSRALAQARPKIFTANMRKADRSGRIFLDWLRNERGATAVLPYSVRARERASVAAPITWDELATLRSARPYTIDDVDELLAGSRSAKLKQWCSRPQSLPDF